MKKIDYKGKYFILQDKLHDDDEGYMDFEIGEMKDDEITDEFLKGHISNCDYYGIPPYVGCNEDLKARIHRLQEESILE